MLFIHKKEKILPIVAIWMDLERIMPSEISEGILFFISSSSHECKGLS